MTYTAFCNFMVEYYICRENWR